MRPDDTQSLSLARPLRFDIEGAAFKRDPAPTFAAMRAAGEVIPIRVAFLGKIWATTTYAATIAMVKDNDLFVQEGSHAGKSGVAGMQWWMPSTLRLMSNNMLLKDEPDHRRLRKLVDGAFARRDILAMRGAIEAIADRILDEFEGRNAVDLAEAYSRRLPLEVICDLLGLPEADRPMFSAWAAKGLDIKRSLDLVFIIGYFNKMAAYLRSQIEACRRAPRPGLISELVRDADDGDKLDEDELLSMIMLLLVAGFETTRHLITDCVLTLEQHPDQKTWLLADPDARMERAVEELARFMSPVQGTKPRYVSRDTEFFGQRLARGDVIMGLTAAANADPTAFDQPDELRLDRFPNQHLVFSSGIHFCLGMQLARVETQSALRRLYLRYPNLAMAEPDRLEWIERLGIRGLKTLPLRLNPTPRRLAA